MPRELLICRQTRTWTRLGWELVMRVSLAFSLMALAPGAGWAQGKKSEEPGPVKIIELKRTEPVSYEKDIEPVFYKKCVTCHSGSGKESRFDISSYDTLVQGGKRGRGPGAGRAYA